MMLRNTISIGSILKVNRLMKRNIAKFWRTPMFCIGVVEQRCQLV